MANKKSYLLGFRVNRIYFGLVGGVVSFIIAGTPLLVTVLAAWFIIGAMIDNRQKGNTRNYVESQRAWIKTKGIVIQDERGGVLSVFGAKESERDSEKK